MTDTLLRYLPLRISRAFAALPDGLLDKLTEVRLRLNAPVSVSAGGFNRCFTAEGRLCAPDKGIRCGGEEIEECLALLSRSSLYSFDDTLKSAYIPFGNGCRAGVCGEAIVRNGEIAGFRRVYGINLRLRRFVKDFGAEAARRISGGGLKGALIYSPPNRGKTTLLRSIARLLSDGSAGPPRRVAIADERCELYVPELAGGLVDLMSGVRKAEAAELLCRSMSPEVIICDELSCSDGDALLQAVNAGVCVIATAHGDTRAALEKRPFVKELLDSGAFRLLIRLSAEGPFAYDIEEYGG